MTKTSKGARNTQLNAIAALADGGFIRIYDGEQPSSPDSPATGTMLAELVLGSPAFYGAEDGVIVATPITDDESADASGTASWFRVFMEDGVTALWDGSVGMAGANMNLSSVAFQKGARISLSAFTFTLSEGGA